MSPVPVERHRTLEVYRLEYLKTSRMPQYSNMNTFHISHESRVPVEHHRTLEVCRFEYPKTSRMPQYSNMNTFHTSHESRVLVARFETHACCLTELRGSVYYLHKPVLGDARHLWLWKMWHDFRIHSVRFSKIRAYLTCSLVFEDVHVRSGVVHLVFQSQTLEQLRVQEYPTTVSKKIHHTVCLTLPECRYVNLV